VSAIFTPSAVARFGESIGAISIDPIFTDTLFISRPSVAITAERVTKKKNDGFGVDSLISELIAIFLSASFISLKSKYIYKSISEVL
jgi:hypothetical protein